MEIKRKPGSRKAAEVIVYTYIVIFHIMAVYGVYHFFLGVK